MTQKTQAGAVKEAFFLNCLIPTGQVAEIYMSLVKAHCNWAHTARAQLLFDNLGLVSTFAISPATPETKKIFNALTAHVESLRDILKEDLLPLTAPKPDSWALIGFRTAVSKLIDRLTPHIAALHKVMKFSDDKRGQWLAPLVQQPTPLTQMGRYSKWRTLVRNMGFQTNMAALGLGLLAGKVSLGSNQGRQEIPELWRNLFHPDNDTVTASARTEASSDLLPPGVTVQSNQAGMLAVTCKFDPKRTLKKVLAEVETAGIPLPDDITLRMAPAELTTLCGYKDLPTTVEDAIKWKANLVTQAGETQDLIQTFLQSSKLARVRAKLAKSLSADELKLLAEAGELNLANAEPPAAKATATKAKAPAKRTSATKAAATKAAASKSPARKPVAPRRAKVAA